MQAPIPVTLIGGYLGAGKTTLVNHAIRAADGRRLMILVNDFGDVSIDADLIESRADGVMQLAGGCVCCSIGSDLVGGLIELAGAPQPPDRVLIETSGVALPGLVAAAVRLVAGLRLETIVVVAALDQIERQLDDRYVGDTVARQLREADVLVPTRLDLVGDADARRIAQRLAAVAPAPRYLAAPLADIAAGVVLEPLLEEPTVAGPEMPQPSPSRHGAHASAFWRRRRMASIGTAEQAFETVTLAVPDPVDTRQWLDQLLSPDLGLVRAKGVLPDLDGGARLLQLVGARGHLTDVSADHPALGRLVCIGLRASHPALAERLSVLAGAATPPDIPTPPEPPDRSGRSS